MPVTIPATGSGTATPIVSTDNVTADSSQVQNVAIAKVVGGALTRTPLPALGTAGTASADVITIQGVASMTPVTGGGKQVYIVQTPTVTAGAYSTGNALGGLLTFANAARVSGGTGILQTVVISCKTQALLPSLELVLFNVTFTAATDKTAFSPSDADMLNCIGVIPISAWTDYPLNSIATRFGLGFGFTLVGTSLFGQLVTRTAMTPGSTTDFQVAVQIIQD